MSGLIGDIARSFGLPPLKRAAGMLTRLLPIGQPILMVGPGSSAKLGQAIGDFGHRRILIVTDQMIVGLGLMAPLTDALAAAGTRFVVFDRIGADAPLPQIEEGIARWHDEDCDAIVAFGGGSVIDAAKAIGLAVANRKHPRDLVGYFRGFNGPPPIYAVPTTAGTGSEVTVAAVVSDPEHERKLVIYDLRLVPRMAALDPCLMTGLPPAVTAATGMDALTHAVEAYIGDWPSEFTDRMALAAVAMIYRHLPEAYDNGQDLVAREQMALASTYAGLAFTRANIGNVHAIAHQLGAHYHVPHGLANAIMLPSVLRFSLAAREDRLATLARRAGVGHPGEATSQLARRFVDSVQTLNQRLGIPPHLDALREADIPALAEAACAEANVNYPVPRVMSESDCEALLHEVVAPEGKSQAKTAARLPAPAPRKRRTARPVAA